MSDAINPDHYKRLPAEAIEIIESAIQNAPDNIAAYNHGQQLKYDLRLFEKGKTLREYLIDQEKHCWYSDRLREHLRKLVEQEDKYEQQEASDLQSLKHHPFGMLKQAAWTPKIGDWVRIKNIDPREAWMPEMDKYDGKIVQVEEFDGRSIVHDEWCFLFDWLEPAEQPKATLNSDKIPEGYRKLNDSSTEPRQLGDLRWSVSEKRYIEIGVDEIGYANRDNWAACRKVEPAIKQSLTTEPPDGWRFLEVGEVIRKGDRYFDGNKWKDRDWAVKETYSLMHQKTVRRNRFEVGEKVVHGFGDRQSISVVENILGDGWVDLVHDGVSTAYHVKDLAPYIEDAT